jgi:hypothetical protein
MAQPQQLILNKEEGKRKYKDLIPFFLMKMEIKYVHKPYIINRNLHHPKQFAKYNQGF